ncbi:4a-hydroxytetrahydrobiopterin dehydratase [Leptospira sp. 201903070]|uniref:4a-hydroxytetrahydrobiopterin dehydratase n=1 Tax=Leptospira ainlahdjerensis TaxID=2810033 RepID=A0ABS2UCX3_9LEPT|nr:4a-hydroxytetrahydrobiopterin dehydratase [Leptospira ainlahdjerensis]MBM9578004.1 4a-hydroxytetrahydrobiopterin dehydratase [Leptospira ainlahdjerensis]
MNPSELERIKDRIPSGWEIVFREEIPFLEKTFRFNSYRSGFEFVIALAVTAEKMNHHPDLTLRYDNVTVVVTTHSKKKLTDLDFSFAEKAEEIFAGRI